MEKECSNETCTKESCEGCPSREKPNFRAELNSYSSIGHVIGVVSGKMCIRDRCCNLEFQRGFAFLLVR